MSATQSKSLHKAWRPATVTNVRQGADDMMAVELKPETWVPHQAGQHYELRLPGHHLSRKYSIVSSPSRSDVLEFGIQLLPYGELSPKFWQLRPGDALEIRGPLGTFTLTPDTTGPLVLIGAGSGITPLYSMYESFVETHPNGEVVMIVGAKHSGRVLHYEEYKGKIVTRFSAEQGRIDRAFLEELVGKYASNPNTRCLTCGPVAFTSQIIDLLLEIGFPESQIRREAFF